MGKPFRVFGPNGQSTNTPNGLILPNGSTANLPDNTFTAFNTGSSIRAYTADRWTYRLDGPDLEHLNLNPSPIVIGPGSSGRFDECGAWLNAMMKDGNLIRGWYHAEEQCNYTSTAFRTHKSVAYAESTDGGLTFYKWGYAFNRELTATNQPTPGSTTGVGDQSVVRFGDNYYMYFLDTVTWQWSVARTPVSSGGQTVRCHRSGDYLVCATPQPSVWKKWFNSSWASDGMGGSATPLNLGGGSGSASTYFDGVSTKVAFISSADGHGLRLSLSSDGVNFTTLADPLLYVDAENWSRYPSPPNTEFVVYPSIISPSANSSWGTSFYLFYTYAPPNDWHRYLVGRKVEVFANNQSNTPQVKVALSRYYSASTTDHWITTAMVPNNYALEFNLGYLYTRPQPGMVELVDCYYPPWDDHLITSNTGCQSGFVKLRTLGWAWSTQQPGTVPLYRCYWDAANDHFIVTWPDCGGTTMEYILGYIPSS